VWHFPHAEAVSGFVAAQTGHTMTGRVNLRLRCHYDDYSFESNSSVCIRFITVLAAFVQKF